MHSIPFLTYAIFAHKNPKHLRRLIEKLSAPYCNFLIHIDKNVSDEVFIDELMNIENVFFTKKRFKSYWGSYQFTKANINILREWSNRFPSSEYIVLLSGQDYPLVNNLTLETFWTENRNKNYIIHVPIDERNIAEYMVRYENYYFFPKNKLILRYPSSSDSVKSKFKDIVLKSTGLFTLPKVAPFTLLYFGSNWLRLTKKTVNSILRHLDTDPSIEKYFKHSLLAEEVMVHSILLNMPAVERDPVINDDLTYTYWDEPLGRYPNPLDESLFERLLDSKHLFARKFDYPTSESLLNKIDSITT